METINQIKKSNFTKIGKLFPNMAPKYVSKKFSAIFKKAGLSGYYLHHTRHTFASLLIMNNVDIYTVRELLGHSSVNVTQIYSHLSTQHLKKAIDKINF